MRFKRIFYFLLISYLVPLAYCIMSQFWADHGGASSTLNFFELPLVVTLCLILYFNPAANKKIISIHLFTPSLSFLGLYFLYDLVYSYFARSPRISDFKNIGFLYKVSPLLFGTLIGFMILILMPILFSYFAWKKETKAPQQALILLGKTTALLLLGLIIFSAKTYNYQVSNLYFVSWSDTRNVIKNGRICSFIYYNNKRKNILAGLKNHKHLPLSHLFYARKPQRRPNIHIILLESFIDPRKIAGLEFNRPPLSKRLTPFLIRKKKFSLIEAPVYGGGSPQTKFEILTGIPALALIDSIEYNLYEGSQTSSFVNALNKEGYHTFAANGSKSGFYNSKLAYQGIGFDQLYFLDKNNYYKKSPGDDYLFDGDFFQANIAWLKQLFSKPDHAEPILNYMVGMYGHLPFERNQKKRPDIITTNSTDILLTNLANQFYYRTEALADFLVNLKKIDPEAIVFIASDHLPPILNKKTKYSLDNKMNIALLLDRFKPVDISARKYYEITHIIWGLLGKHQIKPQEIPISDKNKKTIYFSYITEAMGLQ